MIQNNNVESRYARSLIEASLDPLLTISPEGKITDMNEALSSITGLSREDLKGTDFKFYFTQPEEAQKVYQEVFEKGFVIDYPLTIKDNKLTNVLFNGSVYKNDDGKVIGAVVVARDITLQRTFENELIANKEIAELAQANAEEAKIYAETATTIAIEAVKSKQQFLSNMSHEIRTPMNAIIGFTKVVLKTNLDELQTEYMNAIKLSCDSLIVLINDILDLAKVDAGKMTFEQAPFKMFSSLSAMLHLFAPKIEEKNLELIKEYDSNIPITLLGDPVRLHQIILNLLSNAVKFTSIGKISMIIELLNQNDLNATIKFTITDTGIGIAEEKLKSIFDNFQQASSNTSRLYGGTGLGLAIVKQLVESQGGTVEVVSKLGVGSSFSFTLTFLKTKAVAEIDPEEAILEPNIPKISVLVVEDIALNQLLMKTLLDDFGFEKDFAINGKVAIEKLENHTYDIILMDLHMPVMNGFETTEYIRNNLKLDIPIIALTADVTTVDLAKCNAAGMNDYVAKPVDEKILYSKIINIVMKANSLKIENNEKPFATELNRNKYIDLDYLRQRTKSDPDLMMEMIFAYLNQTPPLLTSMKQFFIDKDWDSLQKTVHKMIPSFSIMGISADYLLKAKKIQEYANSQQQEDLINELINEIEMVCLIACKELEEEYLIIKKKKI